MEPLRSDWRNAAVAAEKLMAEGKRQHAIQAIKDFHDQLCVTRVLDPACGTGNFLYVAMELIKQLEDEVLEAIASLGGQQSLAITGHTVDPHQFLGIEINPRAAAIAELVLWIGFLQIHYRSTSEHPQEPILRAFHNIECRDAVLVWDAYPLPTVVGGAETYPNPRRPDWPLADFIVGNPPFLGKGEPMRAAFGDAYLNALWKANPKVNKSADFVMFWWERAADLLKRKDAILRRFGFVTTNSIDQFFNRRVLARNMEGPNAISIVWATSDHPWTKATKNAAAVRIAMTVASLEQQPGRLLRVVHEEGLDTDNPTIVFDVEQGEINSDLTVGVRLSDAKPLRANAGIASMGPALGGRGFVVNESLARHLSSDVRRPGPIIRPLITGKDITEKNRGRFVIDAREFSDEDELRTSAPLLYQHLLEAVKPVRSQNNDEKLRREWWLYRRSNADFSAMTSGLDRYIATVETTKHRIFVSVDGDTLVEHGVVGIGHHDYWILGVLSSKAHVAWTLAQGGTLENRPRYNKLICFDNFPFPDPDETVKARVAFLAEALDLHRKQVQARHPDISLTGMYNIRDRIRSGAELTEAEVDLKERGLVLILDKLHEDLDAAVDNAYGWSEDTTSQQRLAFLVSLNKQRTTEEATGQVRWLRPDYQTQRFGGTAQNLVGSQFDFIERGIDAKPNFPSDERRRTAAIFAFLAEANSPLTPADIAMRFKHGKKAEKDIAATLRAFVRFGDLASLDGGRSFQLRQFA